MDIYSILKKPVVTEKSVKSQEDGKYVFYVASDANKVEIKTAVSALYGVRVDSVNVVPVRKKERLVGRGKTVTKRKAKKKALVTLKKGETLDMLKFKDTTAKKTKKATTKTATDKKS